MAILEIMRKELLDKWGTEKFVEIIAMSIMGASIGALIGVAIFPNEPQTDVETLTDDILKEEN